MPSWEACPLVMCIQTENVVRSGYEILAGPFLPWISRRWCLLKEVELRIAIQYAN